MNLIALASARTDHLQGNRVNDASAIETAEHRKKIYHEGTKTRRRKTKGPVCLFLTSS
jgi:hypothetical protein